MSAQIAFLLWSLCQRRFDLYVTGEDKDQVGKTIEVAHNFAILDNTIVQQFYGHALGTANNCACQVESCSIQGIARNNKFVRDLNFVLQFLLYLLQVLYMLN